MTKESAKASYIRNRPKRLKYFRDKYKKDRELVFSKLGGKCACCGESEPLFLTLDHVNNDGNMYRRHKKSDYALMYRWFIKNDFPNGFQLLCLNCNQGKHRNGGTCPHLSGSTTRTEVRSSKWSEAPSPDNSGEDIVSSIPKGIAAL